MPPHLHGIAPDQFSDIAAVRNVLTEHGGAWLSDLERYAEHHLAIGPAALPGILDELEDGGIITRVPTERTRISIEPDVAITLRRRAVARW